MNIDQIKSYYPEKLHEFPRFLLKEYLQHKILEIIYESEYGTGLYFLGGTCLRIVHQNSRFSEDLDFDNRSLNETDFELLSHLIQSKLEQLGLHVEIKMVLKGAWHCYIKFPGILHDEGLSGYQTEKILIQLDTEPQNYEFEAERFILNKFDVFSTLIVTPLPLLMSQKIFAILNRPRSKGRDYFDLVFLMSKGIKPDLSYLNQKASIQNHTDLKEILVNHCSERDFNDLAKDVEPFLFNSIDTKKIIHFPDLLKQHAF